MLYLIATPIGNLKDITLRALETLKEVDYIAAEDTRHSGILLKHYDIQTSVLSFHSHSGDAKLDKIIGLLKDGKKIALITDAGTPGISDPAYTLVQAALENQIEISPLPGPTAFLPALVASGMHTHQFVYLGFLPLKKGRRKLIESLTQEKRTVVFYESPHRILKTLKQLHEILGDRPIVIARELTKIHEEFLRGPISEVLTALSKRPKIKGEIVGVLGN